MDSEKISRMLIELRGEKTRTEVAAALGLSVSAIAMYENGERIPRDETKLKIAAYYGKSVEDIFLTKNVTKSDKKRRRHDQHSDFQQPRVWAGAHRRA